uniref:Uncharacterized protein n=1 Tax=Plectus sambesii TaxID=2011161 RepID=A0A914W666_9BILA
MEGRIIFFVTVVVLLLLGDQFVEDSEGCVATVPMDEITLAPTTAPCLPRCPSCGMSCAPVSLCNLVVADWVPVFSPASTQAPADCVVFPGTTNPSTPPPNFNLGLVNCANNGIMTACVSGTAKNLPSGKWEATGLGPVRIGLVSYCSSPMDCIILITNRNNAPFTFTYQDGPIAPYTFPVNGLPLTTDGTYFIVTDICCGTCAACVAKGCNPPEKPCY